MARVGFELLLLSFPNSQPYYDFVPLLSGGAEIKKN